MEVTRPDNSNAPEELGSEALFSYLVDKKGLDVVVGVLGLRKRVLDRHLNGSEVSSGDTKFMVRPDGLEFVMESETGERWAGEVNYDTARRIIDLYIAEQLHEEPPESHP